MEAQRNVELPVRMGIASGEAELRGDDYFGPNIVPGNLPLQESSFVGRVDAVDTIVDTVGEHRVVTLIGVGGVGKTRLALQSARATVP